MSEASSIALAKRLIAKNGRLVTFQQLAASADPDKPWRSTAPAIAASAQQAAVQIPISGLADLGFELTEAELNSRATAALLTAPGTMDLTLANQVLDGSTYGIEWTKALRPGTLPILFAMGIKR